MHAAGARGHGWSRYRPHLQSTAEYCRRGNTRQCAGEASRELATRCNLKRSQIRARRLAVVAAEAQREASYIGPTLACRMQVNRTEEAASLMIESSKRLMIGAYEEEKEKLYLVIRPSMNTLEGRPESTRTL